MKYILVSTLVAIIAFSSCYSGVMLSVNHKLPKKRPKDLTIHFNNSGGMAMLSEDMYLNEDSCIFSFNYGGSSGSVSFSMEKSGLDDVYRLFRDNDFEDIESEKRKVYDRGGITLTLSWDENNITVSNAGQNFVKEEWQKEWNNIVNTMITIKETQRTLGQRELDINIDKSVFGKKLSVYAGTKLVFDSENNIDTYDDETFNIKTMLLPGINYLHLIHNNTDTYAKIDNNINSIKVYYEDGSMKVK